MGKGLENSLDWRHLQSHEVVNMAVAENTARDMLYKELGHMAYSAGVLNILGDASLSTQIRIMGYEIEAHQALYEKAEAKGAKPKHSELELITYNPALWIRAMVELYPDLSLTKLANEAGLTEVDRYTSGRVAKPTIGTLTKLQLAAQRIRAGKSLFYPEGLTADKK